ncbi:MAG: hypothetical protein Q8L59_08855 [Phenylobacterium sp.]|uniref:spermine/spermidine synthase domain-containing protein n=1 Tax=Phenylobacterium sp. TaxID=1871053 RepID=UPI0027370C14|nr:hypothetical protein [Phenylobacterium sp.]MDP1642279.1 hypothetical protein [Phenylobacterium sp.]MDP3116154.1 hypothetical protein [Phenylobacterium sp.]
MSPFAELAYHITPLGALSLRRRRMLALDLDVLEVKLGEDFLMSSLFTAGERALAHLSVAGAPAGPLDVLVGGLGLGYTAAAALDHDEVRSLRVVDVLPEVIAWHRDGLVDLGPRLSGDPRCQLEAGDFFNMVRTGAAPQPGRFHVIAVDIDHSTEAWLNAANGDLYTEVGLRNLMAWLHPQGVFGLWSDAAPDEAFLSRMAKVFDRVDAEVVAFDNPLRDVQETCTIYRGWAA